MPVPFWKIDTKWGETTTFLKLFDALKKLSQTNIFKVHGKQF